MDPMAQVKYAASIVAIAHHLRGLPAPARGISPHAHLIEIRSADLLRAAEQVLVDALRVASMPYDMVAFARHVQACPHGADYGADYAPVVTPDR